MPIVDSQSFFVLLILAFYSWEGTATPQTLVPVSSPERRIVITIDDLPGAVPGSDVAVGKIRDLQRCNHAVLQALQKHNVPALGLVIESKLQVHGERDARASILDQWIVKNMELGNHTYSHTPFSKLSLREFEDDAVKGDVVTRSLLSSQGKSEHYFRYPALDRGRSPEDRLAFEQFFKSRGYQIAPVSIENADYQFNDVLADARAHHARRVAAETKSLYLKHTEAMLDYVESSSRMLFGREVPQVLLIHDNELNAELLNILLTVLEHRGYHFISLEEALSDPAYGSRAEFSGNLESCDLCWNNRLSAIGREPIARPEPPNWITVKFNEIRARVGNNHLVRDTNGPSNANCLHGHSSQAAPALGGGHNGCGLALRCRQLADRHCTTPRLISSGIPADSHAG
jgi:peptidoglycan/xylan/chitin deacetylase (PgdA/CDA1 family)